MAAKKKAVSKKLRFEVFKRDSFKCQYCGKGAPDVVLHCDHIIPEIEGGKTDIINLITSCIDCNLGKGPRRLDDTSVVEKQKRQLDELNERREQMKMMVKWRDGLNKLEDEKIDYIEKRIDEICDYGLSDYGRNEMKKVVRKFDYALILESLEKSASQYLKRDKDGKFTSESVGKFIDYIPRICNAILFEEKHPEIKDINYIKGILRNRISEYAANSATLYIRNAYEAGISLETVREIAKTARNWTDFRITINDLIDQQ
jgi:hypothetical protein